MLHLPEILDIIHYLFVFRYKQSHVVPHASISFVVLLGLFCGVIVLGGLEKQIMMYFFLN